MGRADAAQHGIEAWRSGAGGWRVEATMDECRVGKCCGVQTCPDGQMSVYALLFTLLWHKLIPKFEVPN